MAKTLKQFKQGYSPKAADEKKFVDKHTVTTTPDANGNDDKLFKASNVKTFDREIEHGYNPGSDEEVYESANQVNEKMNLKTAKMGDVVKDFQKSKAPQFAGKSKEKRREMAIAAKLQSEEIEQVEEAEKIQKTQPGWMARMIKRDNPEIAKKMNQGKEMNKLMAKFGGKKLNKTVKEEKINEFLAPLASAAARLAAGAGTRAAATSGTATRVAAAIAKPSPTKIPDAQNADTALAQSKNNQPKEPSNGYVKKVTKNVTSTLFGGSNVQKEAVEPSSTVKKEAPKPFTPTHVKKWKVVHKDTGKARGQWDKAVDAVKHLKSMDPEFQKLHTIVKEDSDQEINVQVVEAAKSNTPKNVTDKSGAVHTPMSRARHLARMALQKQIEKRTQKTSTEVDKKKANEEIDYENVKQYLLNVYENKSQEEKNLLNEMLQTEEGTKLAFVVTYFSGE